MRLGTEGNEIEPRKACTMYARLVPSVFNVADRANERGTVPPLLSGECGQQAEYTSTSARSPTSRWAMAEMADG